MNGYQQAKWDVFLHRDASTERSAAGIVARLKAMVVELTDSATALEAMHLDGYLPDVLGHTSEGGPRYTPATMVVVFGCQRD